MFERKRREWILIRHAERQNQSCAPSLASQSDRRHWVPTGRGGVDRQALTQPDIEARMLIFDWAADQGFECRMDAIGNMFVTRPGRYADRSAVLTGSHLDTQPTGGNFDGIFGVLAALEVLESLEDQELSTLWLVQLVVWTNEEGARFQPTTMGSAVFAGALSLDEALKATDREGISVAVALEVDVVSDAGHFVLPARRDAVCVCRGAYRAGPRLRKCGGYYRDRDGNSGPSLIRNRDLGQRRACRHDTDAWARGCFRRSCCISQSKSFSQPAAIRPIRYASQLADLMSPLALPTRFRLRSASW